MKVLRFYNDDGLMIEVPLEVIAKSRAKYYAEKDSDTTFEDEFNFVMDDDYEGIDWFQNNMDPEDIVEHAKVVRQPRQKSLADQMRDCEVMIGSRVVAPDAGVSGKSD